MVVSANSPRTTERLTDWFRQWRGPLRRFLSRRGRYCSSDLDDIAQEVFLRMLRSDRAQVVVNPQAYLFKVASHVSAEWSMKASWRLPHSEEWLADLVEEGSPQADFERSAMESDLDRAVQARPVRARVILNLHYREGLTHELIAERLATSRRVVKRDLIQAYAELRELLAAESHLHKLAPAEQAGKVSP